MSTVLRCDRTNVAGLLLVIVCSNLNIHSLEWYRESLQAEFLAEPCDGVQLYNFLVW